ncbi:unnamed protein product [Echinostoma caproni]|uniref:Lzipper-MIP1 domain-containing protein n=1 Tax=Echinostoma caproni TaxID=27848 RepID=A0A183B519_9TREM|nr:unnamed protein product [Echinostoma caproni]
MECSSQENSEYESQTDAAGAPPPGRCDNCQDCDDVGVIVELKLELESAQLEVEAASAMRRAAEVKRRESKLLRHGAKIKYVETIPLHCHIGDCSPELPVIDPGCSDREKYNVSTGLKSPGVKNVTIADMDKLDLLLSKLDLPRCEVTHFDHPCNIFHSLGIF